MQLMKLAICKKVGAPNFGSNGASCELTVELPPDASLEMIGALAALHYNSIRAAVDAELAILRQSEPDRQPEPEPDSGYVPRRQRTEPPAPRPERPINPNMLRNDGGPWRGRPEIPEDGRQLLGWAKRNGQDKALLNAGERFGLPGRIVTWNQDEVRDVYEYLTQESGQANGHRNGNGRY